MSINISFEENDNTKFVGASYVIRSDILIPDTITSELDLQPTHAFAKGEKYLGKVYDPQTKITTDVWRERPWGVWRIDTNALDLSLKVEDHILYLLSVLEPKRNRINYYLENKEEYTVSFYIERESLNPSSIEIMSKTLERMSMLCHYSEFSCT